MTTVKQVFEIAMSIADSLNNSGQAVTGDNKEYQDRTPDIINTLQSELVQKGKLFNIVSFEYENSGEWLECLLPEDFNEANKIVIFDGVSYYKSVRYRFEEKEEYDEELEKNVKRKYIYFRSPRTGTIKMEYIPNPRFVESLDDELSISDAICTSVLPYGLSAVLFIGEDTTLASYCQQKYEENKNASSSRLAPNLLEDIEDTYANVYERSAY